jgi:hypothetical protein
MWDDADKSYTVTNDMAHLWAEAYFPGYGWISFDPSPQGDGDLALMDSFSRRMSIYLLRTRMLWLRYVVGYRPSDQQVLMRDSAARIVRSAGDLFEPPSDSADHSSLSAAARFLVTLGIPIALTAFLGYVVWRRRATRVHKRQVLLTADQRRAVQLRRDIVRTLRKWGVACEGKTAEELADDVAALQLNDPAAGQAIIEAYNVARFGNRPMTSEDCGAWRRRLRSLHLQMPESQPR